MIVRPLPDAGGALQYRVKSEANGRVRVVREDQLARRVIIEIGTSRRANYKIP